MARKKVKLQYIEDYTARKISYKKRLKGLIKKTQELSVLCGVDACSIVYGPDDQAPTVWPSGETEARRILIDFKTKSDIDLGQRKLTQEAFLRQSLTKSEEKLARLQRRGRELEMENIMSDLLSGNPVQHVPFGDLGDLMWVIDDKLRSIKHRIRVKEDDDKKTANPPGANCNLNFGNEMMGGINDIMGGNGGVPFYMQAGPSQLSYYQPQP